MTSGLPTGLTAPNVLQDTTTVRLCGSGVQWGVDKIDGYDVDGDICFTEYGKKKPFEKTIDQLADEVLAGKWDNGAERERLLTAAGYDYNAVQKRVNEKL